MFIINNEEEVMELKEGDIVHLNYLKERGWENTGESYCGLEIWKMGEKRMLYDSKKNLVYKLYFFL